jgi:hypothetical protein
MPPLQWNSDDGTFHLGINMAGAVSAGAYTAGALDFLIEALEQWEIAKQSPSPTVPLHKVSIDVISGASAGGMCASIAAVMLQSKFDHISNPAEQNPQTPTTNKFFESWVNKIGIDPLLGTTDLASGKVISFLDCTIIDQIADYALSPGEPMARPYISPSLTLFLTLTNVIGTPYSLNGLANGSVEEEVAYYADKLQFEIVPDANTLPQFPSAKPLPLGSTAGAWPLLKEAAKATGAFPLFLAPRKLTRIARDYANSPWLPLGAEGAHSDPHWDLKPGAEVQTLNVDGGVTNNDPFQLANDFLAIQNIHATTDPRNGNWENPSEPQSANCAVLTIAPFPATALYNPKLNLDEASSVYRILPKLINVLIGQSRFLGESLTAVMSGHYNRFVLAPSDDRHENEDALQCRLLGAFGGFLDRGFRAHDYQLGRRNCQQFLRKHFCLSPDNPIIKAGIEKLPVQNQSTVLASHTFMDPKQGPMIPIIPLCGTAIPDVPFPDRATITQARIDQILQEIIKRAHAIAGPLIDEIFAEPGAERFIATAGVNALIATLGKSKLKRYLQEKLKNVRQN